MQGSHFHILSRVKRMHGILFIYERAAECINSSNSIFQYFPIVMAVSTSHAKKRQQLNTFLDTGIKTIKELTNGRSKTRHVYVCLSNYLKSDFGPGYLLIAVDRKLRFAPCRVSFLEPMEAP